MNIKFYHRWESQPENCPKSIDDIVGKTPVSISIEEKYGEDIVMVFDDGTACKFYHEQDCCEIVSIEDINGDWSDLIGTPLLVAEEREGDLDPLNEYDESYTWTFYTFRSIKGSVDVRWYGESNGYYSEGVDFAGGVVE